MNQQPTKSLLVTGLNGLIGSRLHADLALEYNFDSLDVSHPTAPVDITNPEQVRSAFARSTADTVVHFAAFTNVSAAYEERDNTNGIVYKVNVTGTQNIVTACQESGKHLIHISTAYVFDGNKSGMYTELDSPNPIEWYGTTKAKAEEVVMNSLIPWTIVRIDQPFRSDPFPKADIAHRIVAGLQSNTLYPQFTNHTFGPTYINDLVKVLNWLIQTKTTGLFHATNGESWTDFDFATAVKKIHNLPGEVKPGDLDAYLKTLSRPYQRNTALNSSKLIGMLPFKLKTIEEALAEVTF